MRMIMRTIAGIKTLGVIMPSISHRKPTNLTLDSNLVASAKELGINISQAAETGIRQKIAETLAERWKRENKQALDSSNKYVEQHGLPLESARQFYEIRHL